jgi:hypothetical protein
VKEGKKEKEPMRERLSFFITDLIPSSSSLSGHHLMERPFVGNKTMVNHLSIPFSIPFLPKSSRY